MEILELLQCTPAQLTTELRPMVGTVTEPAMIATQSGGQNHHCSIARQRSTYKLGFDLGILRDLRLVATSSLLRTATLCIRGCRALYRPRPQGQDAIDLQIVKGRIYLNNNININKLYVLALFVSSSFVKFTSQEGVYKTKRFGSCTTTIFSGEVFL